MPIFLIHFFTNNCNIFVFNKGVTLHTCNNNTHLWL
jgi:hypothetical protein